MRSIVSSIPVVVAFVVSSSFLSPPVQGEGAGQVLWEIGQSDNSPNEFALAPDRYEEYSADPLYIVGMSKPERDWPYIQPGPVEYWAGRSPHTFAIQFHLKNVAAEGTCTLHADLTDVRHSIPPTVRVDINDESTEQLIPGGGSKDSPRGDLSDAREHIIEMSVPAAALKEGRNEIRITTLKESWMIYDAVTFSAPEGTELADPATVERASRILDFDSPQVLKEVDGALYQPVNVRVQHLGGATSGSLQIDDGAPISLDLLPGNRIVEARVPAFEEERDATIKLVINGKQVESKEVRLEPVRKWEVYLLAHSHVDIGYTQLQSIVEALHWEYYDRSIAWASETQNDAPGTAFKWNVEVLWALDSYLKRSSPEKRQAFQEAVEKGWIGLDGLYGNELTALCRPEEMVRLTELAGKLRKEYGFEIDSAMISDVPGCSWAMVPVLAKSGIKYFSIGSNRTARLGDSLEAWGDRPFYWVSQSGEEKVLTWVASEGYSWFHHGRIEDDERILGHIEKLIDRDYPYDILQVRYSIGGDNGPPDRKLCDYVRNWNEKYAYPKLKIATTSEAMRAFEDRHADEIPSVAGDFTPYWEDGAASSARETSLVRGAAERLSQGEVLWSLLDRDRYPAEDYYRNWRNVILYNEHTWGAHNSISAPDSEFAMGQWRIKQAFAFDADRESRELLDNALSTPRAESGSAQDILVFNTNSWPRTNLVILPIEQSSTGDRVVDSGGDAVPSQRLSSGELAFRADDVPAFGGKKYRVETGTPLGQGSVSAEGTELFHPRLRVGVDENSGALNRFAWKGAADDLVNLDEGTGLNEYYYVMGLDVEGAMEASETEVTVKESGPLVASLLVNSKAPGCYHLNREIRLVDGIDRVDLINTLDKRKIREKEGLHFGFPFNIPQGQLRVDLGWGNYRPEKDQIPGSCKNWLTVQRWVDISNQDYGVTWATVDAPLIEVGEIPADVGYGRDPEPWVRTLDPTQTFFSYVMNNYWFTNYKADQEGPTTFRYAIQPHGRFDSTEANRFGVETSQPLIAVPVDEKTPDFPSFLNVEPKGVMVSGLIPNAGEDGWTLRLYGASGRPEEATLRFPEGEDWSVQETDLMGLGTSDNAAALSGPISVPPYGMVTLQISRSGA